MDGQKKMPKGREHTHFSSMTPRKNEPVDQTGNHQDAQQDKGNYIHRPESGVFLVWHRLPSRKIPNFRYEFNTFSLTEVSEGFLPGPGFYGPFFRVKDPAMVADPHGIPWRYVS
jgi:hypothetical protein